MLLLSSSSSSSLGEASQPASKQASSLQGNG
jgi:hypothetical protein